MYQAFYAGMNTAAPLLALGLFIGTFIAVSVRAFFFNRADDLQAIAALPLVNDERHTTPRSTP